MGEQLELFGPRGDAPGAASGAIAEPEPLPIPAPVLEGQMDLFADRWLRASSAIAALADFDLETASTALAATTARYPTDGMLRERGEHVAKLADRLRRARKKAETAAAALLAIEAHVPDYLRIPWHRRLGDSLEHDLGAGAVLDGRPAGYHFLKAGDASRAERSLRATLEREPTNAKARSYLGDVLCAAGRTSEARLVHRDALAAAPLDVDVDAIADIAVRDLALSGGDEYDVDGPLVTWAAAIGVLTGVFLAPADLDDGWVAPNTLAALPPGLQMYRWMAAELRAPDDAKRIACRRAMKALSAPMLRAWLGRAR